MGVAFDHKHGSEFAADEVFSNSKDRTAQTSVPTTETAVDPQVQTGAPRPIVLMAEHYTEIRNTTARWLRGNGFECLEVADGQSAIDLLARESRIDLVLSDLLLPRVDGRMLLLHVRKHHPRIPFAVIAPVSELRCIAMRDGADAYLAYPCTCEEIVRLVRNLLATRMG